MIGMHNRAWALIALVVLVVISIGSLPAGGPPKEPVPEFRVDGWCPCVAFAPNGRLLACDLVLRDGASGKVLGSGDPVEKLPGCTCVAFSPDGQRLASLHFARHLIRPPHAICLWDVTADNQLLVSGSLGGDEPMRLWEVATGKEVRQFPVQKQLWNLASPSPPTASGSC
jgi:WD40 repeat protein